MSEDDSQLEKLFGTYRDACPQLEPSARFMPELWQKIEARRSFWFVFQREARTFVTASAALCLLLLVLNFVGAANTHAFASSYADALMADHSAEKTYYTEAIRPTPLTLEDSLQH
jgi:hypothetical protein